MHRRRFLEGAACGALLPGGTTEQEKAPSHEAEARLKELRLELPSVPRSPASLLVPCVRAGDMLYVSGHTPVGPEGKAVVGRLGDTMDVKQGQEAARLVALRILSVVRQELGSLDRVVRVVKTLGMVNCTPDFTQTPAVVNGFSEVFVQVFGDAAGKGARSAVGMASLPGGVPVEVEIILQVR